MIDDDIEGSREERVFRLWINSLGIEDVYVNNLVDDCKDGVLLNKVINKIDDLKKKQSNCYVSLIPF